MRILYLPITAGAIAFLCTAVPLSSQMSRPAPLTIPLECPKGDCPLLRGAPQTTGMRSGFVRLRTNESVGWHSTGSYEESLIILHGEGEALIEGQAKLTVRAPGFAYIPPTTRHNVANTGTEPLEYVYVVAPARTQ